MIRDIKPDNLLFLDDSEDAPLKAIDFGIATICSPDDVLQERCGEDFLIKGDLAAAIDLVPCCTCSLQFW